MEEQRPGRKKGRAELIIEDLAKYGLTVSGVKVQERKEVLLRINPENPYKHGAVFTESDFYRVFNSDGLPVVDKKRLTGIRKWIDSGEIKDHRKLAEDRQEEEEFRRFLSEQH